MIAALPSRSRPKVSASIVVRVTLEDLEVLREQADQDGATVSQVVRSLIRRHIRQLEAHGDRGSS